MTTVKAFIKRYSVLTYFALTFAISWSGVLILGMPLGMPTTSEQFEKLWPIVFLPYFLGPSIASLLLIGLVYGKAGFHELLSRLRRWRVGVRWYAVALLIAPLLAMVILFVLSRVSSVFLSSILTTDDRVSLMLSGIAAGLIFGGLMEELGWTGFVVPEMRRRYGVLTTGLILGVLWGAWHFLPTFWGSGNASGALDLPRFLPGLFFHYAGLSAFRVLMVWVYDHTESLLVAIFMHASLTASALFILAPSVEGVPLFTYYLILATALWVVVAVIAVTNGGQRDRHGYRWDA
ncbi:MAG: type II CAAX endopeptidase family protein [Cyanobacteria bacterium J06635_1]